MRFAYKYRLYPTKAQTEFLDGEPREACSLYNAASKEHARKLLIKINVPHFQKTGPVSPPMGHA